MDKQYIQQIAQVLDNLGYTDPKIEGDEIVANCAKCGDQKHNFQANVKKGLVHCWACNFGGRITDLVIDSLDFTSEGVRELFGAPLYTQEEEREELVVVKHIFDKQRSLRIDKYNNDHSYWHKRGLTNETITHFKLGYDLRTKRVTIPCIENDIVVAVIGRAINQQQKPKYKKIAPKHYWDKSAFLFNLDAVPVKANAVYLVEGQLDCIKMWQLGYKNTVAMMGKVLKWPQIKKLKDRFDVIKLMLDNDDAGHMAVYGHRDEDDNYYPGIAQMLFNQVKVKIVRYETPDPGSLKRRRQITGLRPYVPL